MPSIRISREHHKTMTLAKNAVNRIAKHLAEKFQVDYDWTGHTLEFKRSGVDGEIALSKGKVEVLVNLGFFLSMLQAPIEREINKYLDEEFGKD